MIFNSNVVKSPVVNARMQGLVLLLHKEKPCASRRCRWTDSPSGQRLLYVLLHSFGIWSGQRIHLNPRWCSAWKKINGTIIGTVRGKGSSTCLTEHFQEVMVFSGNSRGIHSLANILRKTTWGRLCCLKAVGMAKWAPNQDGACGPVNHRIVLLEPGKSQNNRNMGRCWNCMVSLWFKKPVIEYYGGLPL